MERSKLNPSTITQLTFDADSESTKVKLVDTELNIELNYQDGDSVTSHPAKLIVSASGCTEVDNNKVIIPALDCSSLREVHVSIAGSGTLNIEVSPTDSGNFFYNLGGAGMILSLCARRIRVTSVNIIGDVHLVGRS